MYQAIGMAGDDQLFQVKLVKWLSEFVFVNIDPLWYKNEFCDNLLFDIVCTVIICNHVYTLYGNIMLGKFWIGFCYCQIGSKLSYTTVIEI